MDIGVGGGGRSATQFWPRIGSYEMQKGGKRFEQKLKRILLLHLQIKFSPKFSTKGKVNLIIKHCKLYKRKKNGFV